MTCFPLFGLALSLAIYFYMKSIYRKVVIEIHEGNYTDFHDIEQQLNQQNTTTVYEFPAYLDRVSSEPKLSEVSKMDFHTYI
jgi:hypothetical protein